MNSASRAVQDSEPADLFALVGVLWSEKWLMASVIAACTALAIVYSLTAERVYRAETVIAEVREDALGDASSLVNQLGGLASLAGMNLASSGSNQEARAVLNSRRLVEEFISRNQLLNELQPKAGESPSLWRAVQRFRKNVLRIREDQRKGVTTVAMDWNDPVVAAKWANDFVSMANDQVRARALAEATRNIVYLNEQIEKTNSVELRRVMYNLVQSEMKTLMFAKGRPEYAFTVIDPAVAPEIRIKPQRTLIVLFSAALGAALGAAVVFVLRAWRMRKQAAQS